MLLSYHRIFPGGLKKEDPALPLRTEADRALGPAENAPRAQDCYPQKRPRADRHGGLFDHQPMVMEVLLGSSFLTSFGSVSIRIPFSYLAAISLDSTSPT